MPVNSQDSPGGPNSGDSPQMQAQMHTSARTSCDRCKRMKIKCERHGGSSCVHCITRGARCDITLVQRKKKGMKAYSDFQRVESRIERLESVLAASGIDPNSVAEADGAAAENADDLPQNVVDRLTTLLISEEGASSFLGASSGLSLFSPQGLQWISESTGSNDLSEFISTLSKTNEGPWKVNNMDLWHSMLPSQREPLPPKEIADILVECFFDTFNNVFPLFDRTTFYDAYSHQYAQQPIGGSAWYACLNVVLCLGSVFWHAHIHSKDHHLKTEISGFTEEKCWKYFRNACSCLTDLMFKDCNLMAVQAIIGMAFMQQTTLDPQTFYILIAAAGRLAHGIGLHRKLDHFGLSEAEANQRRNVFWIVYFLDKTTALRLGHPSVMTDDDIGVDLPSERKMHETTPNGTKIFDIFRSHAELAVLESRIYTELYSEKARNRPHNERLISVGRLDIALLEWKKRLPVEIRPEEPIQCSREQVIPVIVLHFEYFNCLTTVHRISNSGSWTDQRARKNPLSANKRHLSPRIYASHSICLSAARATIRLLNMVDLESGTPRDHIIRMALYYPLSSCLILFANLLQNPKDPYASSDIDLMDIVRSFLSPNALGSTPLNANLTIKIFTELTNVARKFVDKVTLQGLNKAKRTHEKDEGSGWQHLSVPSKEPVAMNDFHTAAEQLARTDVRIHDPTSTSTHIPAIEPTTTDGPAFETQPYLSTNTGLQPQPPSHFSSCRTGKQHSTSNDMPLLNAEDMIAGFQGTSMMDGQEPEWGARMFSESFEWDLANLWTDTQQRFEDTCS